jgi:hypothetical protein
VERAERKCGKAGAISTTHILALQRRHVVINARDVRQTATTRSETQYVRVSSRIDISRLFHRLRQISKMQTFSAF